MATKTKEQLVEEYRERAEADFNPNETVRERLERLKAETAQIEAELAVQERSDAAAKVEGLARELIAAIEANAPGKVCRKLTVRMQRPGEEVPELVEKLEQGKAGLFIDFRTVKPKTAKVQE